MAINYESLRKFARENGDIKFYAPGAEVTILKNSTPDNFDVIEKATTFVFNGNPYTRAQFEKLLSGSKSVTTGGGG